MTLAIPIIKNYLLDWYIVDPISITLVLTCNKMPSIYQIEENWLPSSHLSSFSSHQLKWCWGCFISEQEAGSSTLSLKHIFIRDLPFQLAALYAMWSIAFSLRHFSENSILRASASFLDNLGSSLSPRIMKIWNLILAYFRSLLFLSSFPKSSPHAFLLYPWPVSLSVLRIKKPLN